ncbi:MAG: tetratricopeptide repeat protein, partial [Desulfovibrionales bacterium]
MKKTIWIILILVLTGWANAHSSEPSADFESWLASHKAWNVLDHLAREKEQDPQTILQRTDFLMQQRMFSQAAEMLENAGPFSKDLDFEGHRVWSLAQALRGECRLQESLFHYLQAGKYFQKAEYLTKCRQEPGLERLFRTVWLTLDWNIGLAADHADLDKAYEGVLKKQIQKTGDVIWPDSPFWAAVGQKEAQSSTITSGFETLLIEDLHEKVIPSLIKALGAWAMKDWKTAQDHLNEISQSEVRSFWLSFGRFLETNSVPSHDEIHTFRTQGLIKPVVFWQLGWSGFGAGPEWFVPHLDDPVIASYAKEISRLDPEQARKRISLEAESMLVPEKSKQSLHTLSLALDLMHGKLQDGNRLFKEDQPPLPLTLRLAGILITGDLPDSSIARHQDQVLSLLAESSGIFSIKDKAPFWSMIPEEKLEEALLVYPLDREIHYAFLQKKWQQSPSVETAGELALLFPGTRIGYSALLYLARSSHEQGRTDLAWTYLSRIGADSIPHDREAEFLEARAGLEMELGWEERALSTYENLLARYPNRISPEKKIKLAL